jgi:hypothetical protein
LLNLLGANVEGRFLYFGRNLFDIPYLSIADRTLSDGARIFGHHVVHSNITLGPDRASGILHENTMLMANSTVSAGCKENGPWRYITSDVNTGTPRTRPKQKPMLKGPRTLQLSFDIVSTVKNDG